MRPASTAVLARTNPVCSEVLSEFLKDDIIGPVAGFEITQIICFRDGQTPPVNVFTICAAEATVPGADEKKFKFLNAKRVQLAGLKDRTFGIARDFVSAAEVVQALTFLEHTGIWKISGKPLGVGPLRAEPAAFCAQMALPRSASTAS